MFCNYPWGHLPADECVLPILDDVLSGIDPMDHTILIGSSGSLLDSSEVSDAMLRMVLERVARTTCNRILIETRLDTINEKTLGILHEYLPGKHVEIEFGLESSNPDVLKYCLGKDVDLKSFGRQMELLHSHGFTASANVMIGTPLLGTEEQIRDTVSTIKWALNNGADSTVLFPMNVRKHTLLEQMLNNGIYSPINHILVPLALSYLDDRALCTISLSWADPRQADDDCIIARPSENGCPGIFRFYDEFMATDNQKERRALISNILAMSDSPTMFQAPAGSLKERAERVCDQLGIRLQRV
ncbi:MAG: hypothetical protein II933_01905 [Candidatus Methanomethylophilaceae archaeon]|nr:hypothetical protein [Candidatus Methanomethylophilaceae archaeon]